MESDSAMEFSDDDRPLPSSAGSCIQTHPPPPPEAHDFLSSLLLAPDGEGMLPGGGPVDEEGAGVCPGALPVDADCREDGSRPSPRGDAIATPLLPAPGAHISSDRSRQRRNRRKTQRWLARRAAATADRFLT